MLMKLKMGQVYAIYCLCTSFADDTLPADNKITLSGRGRMTNAANRLALHPLACAYEAERNHKWKELWPSGFKDDGKFDFRDAPAATAEAINAINRELAGVDVEVVLQTFASGDLRLDDNPAFSEAMLITLKPLIRDWPIGESAAASAPKLALVPDVPAATN